MNYGEEQKNELEALSEIYYNEIKVISDKTPISFSIKISPQASNYEEPLRADPNDEDDSDLEDDDADEEADHIGLMGNNQPWIEFQFDLPEKYPDDKPSIQLLESNNLDENDVSSIMDLLNSEADSSLGNVMIFTLVSAAVEWLSNKTDEVEEKQETLEERKYRERIAEEQRKCDGTQVTKQTFLAWKAKFDAEMLKLKLEQQKKSGDLGNLGSTTKRLTGRELFESDKSMIESDLNFVEDLDQNQIEALLQDVDELDLEDDDDDDEELIDTDLEDQNSELSYTDEDDDAD